MKYFRLIIFLGFTILVTQLYAQDDILTEIKFVYPEEIQFEGFAINENQEIHIEAIGIGSERKRFMFSSAWILNAQTREVVWEMRESNTEWEGNNLRKFDGNITLPRGEYEVYYSSFPPHNRWDDENFDNIGDFFKFLVDELFDKKRLKKISDEAKITVRGRGQRFDREAVREFHKAFQENAIISMTGVWDDQHKREGFTLEEPMEIQIYAIGEGSRDEAYDYGWIINTKTRQKVWKMNSYRSEHAGGARKNIMFNKVISLPAGNYVAYYITDGSHSYHKWNDAPPYDPTFWGLTIRLKDPSMKQYIKEYEYGELEKVAEENVIVKFTRLRDDEFLSKGFTLKEPANLRIYALGEGTRRNMVDYGWIVDTKTRRKVWVMEYRNTEHAGGASKNRLVDEVIALDQGNYIVYYVTDGSHSYWDWNSTQPYDPEHWGITVMAVDEDFDPNNVTEYNEEKDKSIIARLVRMRNGENRREYFTLSKNSEVRIYALGEGTNRLADYGWIEDASTGRVIWEMTHRMTDHAGGARKNRIFDDIILLRAGDYVLHYKTDGSHAFGAWNSEAPHDPINWGITVYAVEDR